jgi:hypothetical protein
MSLGDSLPLANVEALKVTCHKAPASIVVHNAVRPRQKAHYRLSEPLQYVWAIARVVTAPEAADAEMKLIFLKVQVDIERQPDLAWNVDVQVDLGVVMLDLDVNARERRSHVVDEREDRGRVRAHGFCPSNAGAQQPGRAAQAPGC